MTTPETINWFEHCVLVYEGQIRSFLRHYFAEGSDIEDCIQETYARLLEMTPEARTSVRNGAPSCSPRRAMSGSTCCDGGE